MKAFPATFDDTRWYSPIFHEYSIISPLNHHFLQCQPPSYKSPYKLHEYYSHSIINHSGIGVVFINLAILWNPHCRWCSYGTQKSCTKLAAPCMVSRALALAKSRKVIGTWRRVCNAQDASSYWLCQQIVKSTVGYHGDKRISKVRDVLGTSIKFHVQIPFKHFS